MISSTTPHSEARDTIPAGLETQGEALSRGQDLTIGIDVGGTKILAAVVDRHNRILGRAKIATPAAQGETALLAAIVGCLEEALREAHTNIEQVESIGVGCPGPLDTKAGVVLSSANLNVQHFPLGPELARVTGRPVLLENDVRVGGYGELKLGAGRDYDDLLIVFVGTGIGGCLVLDGQVRSGATGNAGEIGHTPIKPGGAKCGCGNRGCLEAYASRSAISRRIVKQIRRGRPSILRAKLAKLDQPARLKSKDIQAAFELNDPVVREAVERSAHRLGLALGGMINVLAPQRVILGGGIVEALGESYIDLVRASARRQAIADPAAVVEIVASQLGDDAGALGAALWSREHQHRHAPPTSNFPVTERPAFIEP